MQIKLLVRNRKNEIMLETSGEEIHALYEHALQEGDCIEISTGEECLIQVKLDETLAESILYLPEGRFVYPIPSEMETCYAENAFSGEKHMFSVKVLTEEEAYASSLLSLNAYDRPEGTGAYPHASANIVTRGDSCFYARNAIDGVKENSSHGAYPYHSWAGGAREDLEYTVDFGREVSVDSVCFYLRADFPHDTYWKSLDVTFSDGTSMPANFIKTTDGQRLDVGGKTTTYIHLKNFKQISEPLSWAALTQIEVYGN